MLEDLTATHEALEEWPLPPRLDRVDAVVAAHARFHGRWWDDSSLGAIAGFADESGALDENLARIPKEFAAFCDRLGDRLSARRRHVYERFIGATRRLVERYRTHRHLTRMTRGVDGPGQEPVSRPVGRRTR